MKAQLLTLGLSIALASSLTAQAQKVAFEPSQGAKLDGKTIVKTDVVGLVIGSYHLAVERILNKHLSAQLSYSFSPWRSSEDAILAVGKLSSDYRMQKPLVRHNSLNLDLRIYTSKTGYGHGFYLGPYLNYSAYHEKDRSHWDYTGYQFREKEYGFAYGFGLGFQWYFGRNKNFLVDLSLLGLHRSPKFYSEESAVYVDKDADFKPEDSKALGDLMLRWHGYDDTTDAGQLKSSEGGRRLEIRSSSERFFLRGNIRLGIRL